MISKSRDVNTDSKVRRWGLFIMIGKQENWSSASLKNEEVSLPV
jgi:hypothetical protein